MDRGEPKRPKSNTLTRKQQEAIPHLIGARSLEEGRRKARIAKATLYEWLKQETFQEALERQRQQVITEALERLKASVTQAVDVLVELMGAEELSIKLRTATTILEFALRVKEAEEIVERLGKVERIIFERRVYQQ